MHVVDHLVDTAVEDHHLLMKNQELGDRLDKLRDLDFVLYAKNEERANLVASFITDNHYGKPSVQRVEYQGQVRWRLLFVINAPSTENVVHTLSAFMVCLSELYELEYDGWGCVIQK